MPMCRTCRIAAVLVTLCGLPSTVLAQVIVIRTARMLDVTAGTIRQPSLVIVEAGKIQSVGPSAIPPKADIIDVGDATLLPGLIDSHILLKDEPGSNWVTQRVYETTAMMTLRAARNARLTLLNGFTTVRDLGSSGFVDVALSMAMTNGWIEGPDVIPVGHYFTITGGHCDLTGFAPGILERGPGSGVADGADEVTKAVRYEIKHGAHWIKVCATAGVLSFEGPAGAQQYSEAEIRAAVKEAARHDLRVAAHAHGTDRILAALRAGVSSIEYGSMLTPEAIALMKDKGAWLVPQAYLPESMDPATLPAPVRLNSPQVRADGSPGKSQPGASDTFRGPHCFLNRRALEKNDPWREFQALVRQGMTPVQAIQSATSRAAAFFQLNDRGRLAPGLVADVIAVAGVPTSDISTMRNVRS